VASLSQGRTAAAQCGLFTYKSVPVIFEPPCTYRKHACVFIGRIDTRTPHDVTFCAHCLPLGNL